VNEIVAALSEQLDELRDLLVDADLSRPSACDGWSIGDVVLHLAHTNELAIMSAEGTLAPVAAVPAAGAIDDGADAAVARERGSVSGDALVARWQASADRMRAALLACDPSARLQWVAGTLAARTLATTRLAESWIHTGDIAFGLGVTLAPAARLTHIARLAWRTIPYAFEREGLAAPGPVAFRLEGVGGERWWFGDDDAPTVISGDGVELCHVASRRVPPSATSLVGEGPDAEHVLAVVRTWA
jgi:uncharacterized protein (TIGR03084 family)